MQRDRVAVARTWLRVAQRDLNVARASLDVEPSISAFLAQQGAEKALKGALLLLADDHPRTHTAGRLVRELRALDPALGDDVEREAAALDLYYLTARYPDTVGDEDPGTVISREDALVAVTRAERVLALMLARVEAAEKPASP